MTGPGRVRPLLLLLVGAGTLCAGGVPAGAVPAAVTATRTPAGEAEALSLLALAAHASRTRSVSGTQQVSSWVGGVLSASVVRVSSDPATARALDDQLLARLAEAYTLSVTGTSTCSGRSVTVVDARRPDGQVAARFWLDRATGLPLRRELWDARGDLLRSSEFVDVVVGAPLTVPAAVSTVPSAAEQTDDTPADDPPATSAWRVPAMLPGGYQLFSVSRPPHGRGTVQHLSYSDGLSAVSVFSQPGQLGTVVAEGYRPVDVAGAQVWVDAGMPARAVWSGDGQVFTLVTDGGELELRAAVGSLPRDAAVDDGPVARLGRGLSRVGSWLTPTR